MNRTTLSSTRTGKIARLPREIRQQLNRWLEDGESAQELVAWFSLLPAMEGPRKTPKDTKRRGCDSLVTHPAGDPAIFRNPFSFRALCVTIPSLIWRLRRSRLM